MEGSRYSKAMTILFLTWVLSFFVCTLVEVYFQTFLDITGLGIIGAIMLSIMFTQDFYTYNKIKETNKK